MIILLVNTVAAAELQYVHTVVALQQVKISLVLQLAGKFTSASVIRSFTFCRRLESSRDHRPWVVTPVTSPVTRKNYGGQVPHPSLPFPLFLVLSSLQSTFSLLCPCLLSYHPPTTIHQCRHHQGTKHENFF